MNVNCLIEVVSPISLFTNRRWYFSNVDLPSAFCSVLTQQVFISNYHKSTTSLSIQIISLVDPRGSPVFCLVYCEVQMLSIKCLPRFQSLNIYKDDKLSLCRVFIVLLDCDSNLTGFIYNPKIALFGKLESN